MDTKLDWQRIQPLSQYIFQSILPSGYQDYMDMKDIAKFQIKFIKAKTNTSKTFILPIRVK